MSKHTHDGYNYRDAARNAHRFTNDLLDIMVAARVARGISQTELAERINQPVATIRGIENGSHELTLPIITAWIAETGVQLNVSGHLMSETDTVPRDHKPHMDSRLYGHYLLDGYEDLFDHKPYENSQSQWDTARAYLDKKIREGANPETVVEDLVNIARGLR